MDRCEHYTLDCQQEKRTCEGCAYYENKERGGNTDDRSNQLNSNQRIR